MEYQATSKYVRIATRKARLVADAIRKLTPDNARIYLAGIRKHAATPLLLVLESAIANAKQKNVDVSTLSFKTIEIMGGPVLKRFQPVSRGSAHGYKKRMTHIRIVLTDQNHGVEKKSSEPGVKPTKTEVLKTANKAKAK